MNLTNRQLWKPQDGHGAEDLDYTEYKFFNPAMPQVEQLLLTTTAAILDGSGTATTLPKRVKLSDSAMGLVVLLGMTCHKTWSWWPLNFNSAGYAIMKGTLNHFGHAFERNGVACHFGTAKSPYFVLCGTKGHPANDPLILGTLWRFRRTKQIRRRKMVKRQCVMRSRNGLMTTVDYTLRSLTITASI